MADISITAANVVAGAGAGITSGVAGETIAAGKVLYYDSTSGKWLLADSNAVTALVRTPTGIALNGASNGQPLSILTEGLVTIGATLTAGIAYYLSDTPGGICPVEDVGSGEYPSIIGLAISTTVLKVKIQSSGVAL